MSVDNALSMTVDTYTKFPRLSTIVKLLGEGLKMECSSKGERKDFGERLKTAISSFTVAFLPHMREEEEVAREWERGEGGVSDSFQYCVMWLFICVCV